MIKRQLVAVGYAVALPAGAMVAAVIVAAAVGTAASAGQRLGNATRHRPVVAARRT